MNTIRELKQQEKYKSMLKRKNKEKKIYKDKNASLQLEKQRLYIALRNKDKEIERLNNIIKRLEEFIEYLEKRYKDITGVIGSYGSKTDMLYGKKDMIKEILKKCKEIEQGSDKE